MRLLPRYAVGQIRECGRTNVHNSFGNSPTGAAGMAALRMAVFGSLSGALLGAVFAVAITSTWPYNGFEPRVLALFGALFGGFSGAALGACFSGLAAKGRDA